MKTKVVVGLLLTLPLMAEAHRGWIVPSATVISAESAWAGFDAAVSNDIFFADYVAIQPKTINAIGPDGKAVELQNAQVGKYRSTFDIELAQEGTYKVATASQSLMARWVDAEGKRRSFPPRGQQASADEILKAIPKKAKDVAVSQNSRRIETFVSKGAPNKDSLAITGQGLELLPITHPNDLFAGEQARFQLLIDGKPAKGAKVSVVADGMRYRNQQNEIEVLSDDKGEFAVTWPQAGKYWLGASYRDTQVKKPATERNGSYVAVFEVLPE